MKAELVWLRGRNGDLSYAAVKIIDSSAGHPRIWQMTVSGYQSDRERAVAEAQAIIDAINAANSD
jgi:hypothetical protein